MDLNFVSNVPLYDPADILSKPDFPLKRVTEPQVNPDLVETHSSEDIDNDNEIEDPGPIFNGSFNNKTILNH